MTDLLDNSIPTPTAGTAGTFSQPISESQKIINDMDWTGENVKSVFAPNTDAEVQYLKSIMNPKGMGVYKYPDGTIVIAKTGTPPEDVKRLGSQYNPGTIASLLHGAFPAIGAGVGTLVSSPTGPGAIIGGTLGSAGGSAINKGIQKYLYPESTNIMSSQTIKDIGTDAVIGGITNGFGALLGKGLGALASNAVKNEAHPAVVSLMDSLDNNEAAMASRAKFMGFQRGNPVPEKYAGKPVQDSLLKLSDMRLAENSKNVRMGRYENPEQLLEEIDPDKVIGPKVNTNWNPQDIANAFKASPPNDLVNQSLQLKNLAVKTPEDIFNSPIWKTALDTENLPASIARLNGEMGDAKTLWTKRGIKTMGIGGTDVGVGKKDDIIQSILNVLK